MREWNCQLYLFQEMTMLQKFPVFIRPYGKAWKELQWVWKWHICAARVITRGGGALCFSSRFHYSPLHCLLAHRQHRNLSSCRPQRPTFVMIICLCTHTAAVVRSGNQRTMVIPLLPPIQCKLLQKLNRGHQMP